MTQCARRVTLTKTQTTEDNMDTASIVKMQLAQLQRLREVFPKNSFRKTFYAIFSDYATTELIDALLSYEMSETLRSEMLAMKMALAE